LNCGLGGQPVDPAPFELGWVEPTTTVLTTTKELPPLLAEGGTAGSSAPAPPPPPPAVYVPAAPKCQELCVDGFGDNDAQLNGRYFRISRDDGGLFYWSMLGTLENGKGCRLHQSHNGVWRYLQAESDSANFSIGEGTQRSAAGTEVPEDDYVLTPTGGFQVSYQCCPVRAGSDVSGSSLETMGDGTTNEDSGDDSSLTIVIVVVAALLCVLPGLAIFFFRRKFLRAVDYEDASAQQLKEAPSLPDPEANRGGQFASDTDKPGRAGQWRGREVSAVNLENKDTNDRSASAIADVLGRSAKIGATDGIYEGPTRNWWKNNPGDPANRGVGGTGFEIGQEVRLRGLQSQPTWNNSDGVVEGFDPKKGFLHVKVADGRIKQVSPENCISLDLDYGRGSPLKPSNPTPADIRMQLNSTQLGLEDDGFSPQRNASFGGPGRTKRSSSGVSASSINYYDGSSANNSSMQKLSNTSSLSFGQTATSSQFTGLHQADRQVSQSYENYNTTERFAGTATASNGRWSPPPQGRPQPANGTPLKAKVKAVEVKAAAQGWSSQVRHEPGGGRNSFQSGPPKLPSPPRPNR